jgi:hypothetical protein
VTTKRKISKFWLFSPILIAAIISLLSMLLGWRNIDLGFMLKPSMHQHLGQSASVKLDYDLVEAHGSDATYVNLGSIILMGNLALTIEPGDEFALWVSPFLANFAEIPQSRSSLRSLVLRSVYAAQSDNIAEPMRIITPQDRIIYNLNLSLSGRGTVTLHNLHINNLTLDVLGVQQIIVKDSTIENIDIVNSIGTLTWLVDGEQRSISSGANLTQVQ